MVDILISGGTVVNGPGQSRKADLAIAGEQIVLLGDLKVQARTVIEVSGKVVAPGFIDTHSHADFILTHRRPFLGKVTQGVTTEVIGNCGISAAPYEPKTLPYIREHGPLIGQKGRVQHWFTWEKYFEVLKESPLVTNIVPLVGHGNLKKLAGSVRTLDSQERLKLMKQLLRKSLEQGVHGFSTGLIYDPGIFSPTEEILALARVLNECGGVYASHIRGEGETLLQALEEAISIGRQAGVPVQISHLKAAGPANWHQTEAALKLIEKARTSGLEVSYDQYPYTAASTSLTALLPPRAKEGGWSTIRQLLRDSERRKKVKEEMQQGLPGWENYSQSVGWEKIIISQVRTKKNRWLEGLTVTEICRRLKKEPVDFVLELLEEEKGAVSIIYFSMSETSVETLLRETIGFIGTDGLPSRRPHPRLWGSFTRFLGHYVREKKLMSLEQAIEKMSRLPAAKFGLKDRGELAPGRVADIVVFDPERVKDAATFQEPAKPSEGIDLVLVNGKIVLRGKHFTGATPGKLILRR